MKEEEAKEMQASKASKLIGNRSKLVGSSASSPTQDVNDRNMEHSKSREIIEIRREVAISTT